jgi:LacI family transcriptional regulator
MQSDAKQPTGNAKRASISDVARLAGCAPVTVSRRLNDPKLVSPDVVRAIDEAISQLGYVRNESARALRSNRSRLVGAIIPTLRHSIYAEMLEGLQQNLAANGFALVHNTTEYDLDEEFKQARTLIERGVEALVLVGTRHRQKTFELLHSRRIIAVVTYALEPGFGVTSVGFDNAAAGALAARRLHELGHRRFGMLAGITANNDRAKSRVDGFVTALAERGIDPDTVAIEESVYQIGEGRAAMARLLARSPDVTGIMCGSDILAVGALYECRRRRIAVPERLSIIGFDNLEIAAYTEPALSTLNVPAYEMGIEAANFLVAATDGRPGVKRVELEVQLIERQTTGEAPRD